MDATHALCLGIVGAIAVSALKPSDYKPGNGIGVNPSSVAISRSFKIPEHDRSKVSPKTNVPITGGSPELTAQLNAEFASLPKVLQDATQEISIKQGCSPDWGCNGTVASASGSKQQIKIWNGGEKYFPVLAHESAHLLAYKLWQKYEPPKEYADLWKEEGGVSEYGSMSPTEDFAEAMQKHIDGKPLSERKRAFIEKTLKR